MVRLMDGINNSMDMSSRKLWEIVKDSLEGSQDGADGWKDGGRKRLETYS